MPKQEQHLWHLASAAVSSDDSDLLEANAAKHWNAFYRQNQANFFKDRHYLEREFPQLAEPGSVVLEVGCGVGNTAYPLLELNPSCTVFACDFAPEAVELVKANPEYKSGRIHAFVADITTYDMTTSVNKAVDFCTMVFVLSAVAPAKMPAAIANVAAVLKPGTGRVLVRDYAEGDLAQLRLAGPKRSQRLSHNFYVRSDGTRAFYFTQASLVGLFNDAGFTCENFQIFEREIENRKQQVVMHRRWVQATFVHQSKISVNEEGRVNDPSASKSDGQQQLPNADMLPPQLHQTQEACSESQGVPQHISDVTGSCDEGSRRRTHTAVASSPYAHAGDDKQCAQATQLQLTDAVSTAQPAMGPASSAIAMLQSANSPPQLAAHSQGGCESQDVPAQQRQQQEWEPGGTTPDVEPFTGTLFQEEQLEEVKQLVELEPGGLSVQVVSVSREYRNTLEHTGLMCWESSLPLARFLLAAPSLLQGRSVLELGSGVSPLCCMAALRHCRKYVATDGSLQACQGLARNLDLNCRHVIMERARVQQLTWGSEVSQRLLLEVRGQFDIIVGADVVYAPEAINSLFATMQAVLVHDGNARIVLCYIVRKVCENSLIQTAYKHGLEPVAVHGMLADAADQVVGQDLPFRLLLFRRTVHSKSD